MTDIAKILLDQGNLVALLLLGAVVHLYRENRRLIDRYEAKADTLLAKHEALATSVKEMLAPLLRQRRPPQ